VNFFSELKRRNVYKVAVAYAIVGWLLIQIATQVFPFFEIPNWAVRLVVLAIVVGFPIALVMAWAFELTPEGIKRTEDIDLATQPRAKSHAWIYVAVIGALLSIALFFVGRYMGGNRSDSTIPQKSIAYMALLATRRQFDEMIAALLPVIDGDKDVPPFFRTISNAALANLYMAKGERTRALPLRARAEESRKALPNQEHLPLIDYTFFIQMEARFGDREAVEREVKEMFSETEKDKWQFPNAESAAAVGYMLLGDFDRALPLLQDALSRPSADSLTPGYLRLDPIWDPFRNDPRFQKLCEEKPK